MFKHTISAGKKLLHDIALAAKAIAIIAQLGTIGYLLYAIWAQSGFIYANIALLVVAIAYFVYYIIFSDSKDKELKAINGRVGKAKKYIDLTLKVFNIAVALYGIIQAGADASAVTVMFCFISIIGWVIQVLVELLLIAVRYYYDLFVAGIEEDVDSFVGPVSILKAPAKKLVTLIANKKLGDDPRSLRKKERLDRFIEKENEKKEQIEKKNALREAKRAVLPKPEKNLSTSEQKIAKEPISETERILAEAEAKRAEAEAIKAETEKMKAEAKAKSDAEKALARAEAEAKKAAGEKARLEAKAKAEKEKDEARAIAQAKRAEAEKAKAEKAAAKAAEGADNKKGAPFSIKLPDIGGIVKGAESIIKSIGAKKDKPENQNAESVSDIVEEEASHKEENKDTANV